MVEEIWQRQGFGDDRNLSVFMGAREGRRGGAWTGKGRGMAGNIDMLGCR